MVLSAFLFLLTLRSVMPPSFPPLSFDQSKPFPSSAYARLAQLCAIVQAIVVLTLTIAVTVLFWRNTELLSEEPVVGVNVYLVVFGVGIVVGVIWVTDAVCI